MKSKEKKELIDALKRGLTLMIDHTAKPEQRKFISDLKDKGLINLELKTDGIYSIYAITWRQSAPLTKTIP